MKLQNLSMRGVGRKVEVSLFLGDDASTESSREWMEAIVQVPVQGIMDPEGLQEAAMTILRDALNAEIATLRSGPLG